MQSSSRQGLPGLLHPERQSVGGFVPPTQAAAEAAAAVRPDLMRCDAAAGPGPGARGQFELVWLDGPRSAGRDMEGDERADLLRQAYLCKRLLLRCPTPIMETWSKNIPGQGKARCHRTHVNYLLYGPRLGAREIEPTCSRTTIRVPNPIGLAPNHRQSIRGWRWG